MSLEYEAASEPLHIFCEVVVLKLRTVPNFTQTLLYLFVCKELTDAVWASKGCISRLKFWELVLSGV